MRDDIPASAIPISERLPRRGERVVGWVSDEAVAIYGLPAVVWWTPYLDGTPQWWSGLPTTYIEFATHRWTVTHWMPLPA